MRIVQQWTPPTHTLRIIALQTPHFRWPSKTCTPKQGLHGDGLMGFTQTINQSTHFGWKLFTVFENIDLRVLIVYMFWWPREEWSLVSENAWSSGIARREWRDSTEIFRFHDFFMWPSQWMLFQARQIHADWFLHFIIITLQIEPLFTCVSRNVILGPRFYLGISLNRQFLLWHLIDLRSAQVYCVAIFLTCWHPSHITISFLL